MEAGSSSGTAPMAAPKKGALWIVIAIVIAVALTATVMDVVVFPMLKPTQSADLPKHLMTFGVGYDAPNFNPDWTAKAGQVIVVTMNNSGTMAHEFLLFDGDRATILKSAKAALALAESHHNGYQNDEAIGNLMVDEYTEYHDSWTNLSRVGCPDLVNIHGSVNGKEFICLIAINNEGNQLFAFHVVDRDE